MKKQIFLLTILTAISNIIYASFPINENLKNEVNTRFLYHKSSPEYENIFVPLLSLFVLFSVIFFPLYLTRSSKNKIRIRLFIYVGIILILGILILNLTPGGFFA